VSGSVIILSGPVGAGKTTVAQELTTLLPAPIARIEGDVFWSFIAKPGARPRRENFMLIMRAMTAASVPFVRTGHRVILDFSVPPQFLRVARIILKDAPIDFVVVRPDLAVCETRAAARKDGTIGDYRPYRELYALFDEAERHTVGEDEADTPAAIAVQIRNGLAAGKFRVTD
jgi:predicted kinase